jgi:hypothetical protein
VGSHVRESVAVTSRERRWRDNIARLRKTVERAERDFSWAIGVRDRARRGADRARERVYQAKRRLRRAEGERP